MKVTSSVAEVRRERHSGLTSTWGFVPTMGFLHAGHLALVRRAREDNERVAVSIYVNPTQFAPHEDLGSYPRDLDRDLELLRQEGVDLVFTPDDRSIYPPGFQTYVDVETVSKPLEGASRPHHFRGVATVVAKLFNVVQPTRAYFGQKDAQQVVVVKRMVSDLNFPLDLVVCPTVREADGLATSSRNVRLSAAERQAATVLFRALSAAQGEAQRGKRDASSLRRRMEDLVKAEPLARLDYASVADPDTLEELTEVDQRALLSLAVFFGATRLIDNVALDVGESQG